MSNVQICDIFSLMARNAALVLHVVSAVPIGGGRNEKGLLIAATVGAIAAPALADEVGIQAGPVGAGVTVGESHRDYDRDRPRDKTIIKEHEPSERTTVIKKEHEDGSESKTVIHKDY